MQLSASTLATFATLGLVKEAVAVNWGQMWVDGFFLGANTIYQANDGQCVSFTGTNSFWNDVVSSLEVNDLGECQFFVDAGCSGAVDTFQAGSYGSVPHNDAYSSFRCTFV